ncbi:hypothetical protein COO60DRAFT_1627255 [Scenedesmus sp. NREL 46B-D3]|nr:hypothetical protein COO60DRAFT_1627255 [Scenedesmus sp. NREL 46B-D3]
MVVKLKSATKKEFRSVIGAFVTPLRAAQEWWKDYAAYAKLLARNDPLLRVAVKKLDKAFAGMPVAEAALQELWDLALATEKCMRTSQAQVVHCLQDITGLPQQVLMLLGGEEREELRLVFRKLNLYPPLKRAFGPLMSTAASTSPVELADTASWLKQLFYDAPPDCRSAVFRVLPQLRNLKALQEIAPHLYLQRAKTMVADVIRNAGVTNDCIDKAAHRYHSHQLQDAACAMVMRALQCSPALNQRARVCLHHGTTIAAAEQLQHQAPASRL